MQLIASVDWRHYMFMIPLGLLSVFLVLVILVQRGRGGGLTGALGGMGGQSAFGTKAGDVFTRITIIVAAIWVVLSMASLKVLNSYASTGGLSPAERGSRTINVTPKTEGGLLPSATTKSGESPAEKTTDKGAESEPAATKSSSEAEAPAAAPVATAPAATPPADADAKGGDGAKP
jgi:preprotein translocase subunit SecG